MRYYNIILFIQNLFVNREDLPSNPYLNNKTKEDAFLYIRMNKTQKLEQILRGRLTKGVKRNYNS